MVPPNLEGAGEKHKHHRSSEDLAGGIPQNPERGDF